MLVSPTKMVLTLTAVVAMAICCTQESNAQRGFRIGNVLQAGGGQGFRLGGDRFGMQFPHQVLFTMERFKTKPTHSQSSGNLMPPRLMFHKGLSQWLLRLSHKAIRPLRIKAW